MDPPDAWERNQGRGCVKMARARTGADLRRTIHIGNAYVSVGVIETDEQRIATAATLRALVTPFRSRGWALETTLGKVTC